MDECRCCLALGSHKNLYSTYIWLDRKEVYSDMLKECFNIFLTTSNEMSSAICETCIGSLRDSASFKSQVIQCEQKILTRIKDVHDDKGVVIKIEPDYRAEEIDIDEINFDDMVASDTDYEPVSGTKKKKTKNKKSPDKSFVKCKDEIYLSNSTEAKSEIKSSNDIPVNSKLEEILRLPTLTAKKSRSKDDRKNLNKKRIITIDKCKEGNKSSLKKFTKIFRAGSKIIIKNNPVNVVWTSKTNCDKQKHIDNLQTILQYSNATPFKSKSLLGYICGYCDNAYPDPVDLRSHTQKEHQKERLKLKTTFDLCEYTVKLDIVDLSCLLCKEKFDNLAIFKNHLTKMHKKIIHDDINNHLLQFKLSKGDVYDCAMCTSKYETFKMLQQHMNTHYSNYKCKVCDASFTTKRSLQAHNTTHENGSFKCEHCEKIFTSRSKKQYHERTKHLGTRSVGNCPFCNETFRSYYQRNSHLIKVHNSEAPYKCNVCNKSYILRSLLMCHIKKSHLMERNHQCTECGYKFFSKKALAAHMIKHTGERKYLCEVCHKSYARKYTLREHLRIHNNDRRFRCDVCLLTFVQKCSLKSHLLSNHGISMAACEIKKLDE